MSDDQPAFDARAFVRTLTRRPGVYRMLDVRGKLLYVGKARDLRRRVGSYFGRKALDAKTHALVQLVAGIEVTITATEQEALLLEYNLIKEHKPRFNVVLRDDKSYPYIRVSREHPFPRFEFHRGRRDPAGQFLGPFPNAGAVRDVLQQLQKLFRVRQCTDVFFANRSRPCLQYQIRRCSGPCVGMIDPREYARDVEDAIRFIQGRDDALLADLVARMERSSADLQFERAADYRDRIAAIRRIQEQQIIAAGAETDLDAVAAAGHDGSWSVALLMIRGGRVLGCRNHAPRAASGTTAAEVLSSFLVQHYMVHPAPPEILVSDAVPDGPVIETAIAGAAGHPVAIRQHIRGTRRRWVEMASTNARQAALVAANAAATLDEQFDALERSVGDGSRLERIECFDVSHTQCAETVASCVVFGRAGPVKASYRRFNIGGVAAGDDYGALSQAVERRYGRIGREQGTMPDLVLIDGGRGQLRQARAVLDGLGLGQVTVIAVAKGEGRRAGHERLYRNEELRPLDLAGDSPAHRLVQRVRDEAHRFAISGHRQRRGRARAASVLEEIPGLGPRRRKALLQAFGGLQGISRAGVDDLARTSGISRELAERVYGRFHGSAD